MKRAYFILIITVLAFLTGLATGFSHFFRLANVLSLILVSSYLWSWLSLWRLEATVERQTARVQVGGHIAESIRIGNMGPIPKTLLEIHDPTNMPGQGVGRAIGLPPRSHRSWLSTIPCRKRGEYTIGPLTVASSDLFGLFNLEKKFGEPQALVVFPRTVDLPNFRVPAARRLGEGNQRERTISPTPHSSRVREYAFGDSLNRIHWLTSARLGRLMSKEYDTGQSTDLWLLIDLEEAVQAGEVEDSTDEYAVSIAASIARKYLNEKLTVGLIAYGDERYFLEHQAGSGQMAHILEYLAKSKAEGKVTLDQAISREETLFGRSSSLIVITSSHRPEWIQSLNHLARVGVSTEVVLLDSSSFGSGRSNGHLTSELRSFGIHTYSVSMGDDLSQALSLRHSTQVETSLEGVKTEVLL